jgi:hypothetical protein
MLQLPDLVINYLNLSIVLLEATVPRLVGDFLCPIPYQILS